MSGWVLAALVSLSGCGGGRGRGGGGGGCDDKGRCMTLIASRVVGALDATCPLWSGGTRPPLRVPLGSLTGDP